MFPAKCGLSLFVDSVRHAGVRRTRSCCSASSPTGRKRPPSLARDRGVAHANGAVSARRRDAVARVGVVGHEPYAGRPPRPPASGLGAGRRRRGVARPASLGDGRFDQLGSPTSSTVGLARPALLDRPPRPARRRRLGLGDDLLGDGLGQRPRRLGLPRSALAWASPLGRHGRAAVGRLPHLLAGLGVDDPLALGPVLGRRRPPPRRAGSRS